MRLKNGPFKAIKSGTKKVELRLNDEKRKLIKEHDTIEFENRITLEKIEVEVIKLHHFDSFSELYKHFDKISIGYKADEIANPEDMDKYYSKEEQANAKSATYQSEFLLNRLFRYSKDHVTEIINIAPLRELYMEAPHKK